MKKFLLLTFCLLAYLTSFGQISIDNTGSHLVITDQGRTTSYPKSQVTIHKKGNQLIYIRYKGDLVQTIKSNSYVTSPSSLSLEDLKNQLVAMFSVTGTGITEESDPTISSTVKAISTSQVASWSAAAGWGNHATVGYLTPTGTATLTGKTVSGLSNTFSNIPITAIDNLTTQLASKQAALVSGTTIKSINGNSILGPGNIDIVGGGAATTDASALTTGTLPDNRLSSNVPTLSSTSVLTNKTINGNNNTLIVPQSQVTGLSSALGNKLSTGSLTTINGQSLELGGNMLITATPTTSANDLTAGTLSDARLSTNIPTLTSTSVLTNKTISGTTNTLSNIPYTALTGTSPFVDLSSTQTAIAGAKTFNNQITFTNPYAQTQAIFGNTGQGAKVAFRTGSTGTTQMTLGYAGATSDQGVLENTSNSGLAVRTTGTSTGLSLEATGTGSYVDLKSSNVTGARLTPNRNLIIQDGGTFTDNGVDRLQVSGSASVQGLKTAINNTIKTANYTVLPTDNTILVDASSGNLVITLPTATSSYANGAGAEFIIKKIDPSANTVTVKGNVSDLIDGFNTKILTLQYENARVKSNGSTWQILSVTKLAQSAVTNLTEDLESKQEALISGTNVKTVNGSSILGSGDITITATPTTSASALTAGTLSDARLSPNIPTYSSAGEFSGKTISGSANTITNVPQASVTNLVTDLSSKQAALISGTTIKTINGAPILGSGDISIAATATTNAANLTAGTLPDARLSTNIPTVSSASVLTNKTISGSVNTITNIPQSAVTGLASDLSGKISTGTISTVNGLNLESGSPLNITTATSYQFVTPEMFVPAGTTPSATYDWTNVFVSMVNALADGGEINLQPGKVYNAQRLLINGKSATIRGNGATLKATQDQGVLSLTGGWSWQDRVVTDIDPVEKTITLATADATLKLGDIIKVYSDDFMPGSPPKDGAFARIGEYMTVQSVSGNVVKFSGYFKEDYRKFRPATYGDTTKTKWTISTAIKAAKSNGVGFKVYNLKFDTAGLFEGNMVNGSLEYFNSHYFGLVSTVNSVVDDISCKKGFGALLSASSNYNYKYNRVNAENMVNQQSTARFGYGINDRSGQNGTVTNSTFIDCRHGYTTNTDQRGSASPVEYYGRTRDVVVSNCSASGSSNSGFDTHEEAYNVMFINNITNGSFEGDGAIGAGVTTRGEHVTIRGHHDRGSKVGVRVEGEFAKTVGNTIIEDSRFEDNQVQSLLVSTSVNVRNSFFSTKTANSAMLVYDSTDVYLEDVTLKARTSSTTTSSANYVLQLYDKGQLKFKNLTLDASEMPIKFLYVNNVPTTNKKPSYFMNFRTAGYNVSGDGLTLLGNLAQNNVTTIFRDDASSTGNIYIDNIGAIPAGVNKTSGVNLFPNVRIVSSSTAALALTPRSHNEKVFDSVNRVWYQANGLNSGNWTTVGGTGGGGGGTGNGDVLVAGDNVFSGNNSFSGNSDFTAPITQSSTLNVTGATTLGTTAFGVSTINGTMTPGVGSAYNIGNSTTRLSGVYANSFLGGAAVTYGTTVASTPISFRQGSSTLVPFGMKATTGTAFFQTPGVEPADIPSAQVFINSTTKGFLGARLTTTQRDAIASPAEGLEIYNTTTKAKEFFDGTVWKSGSTTGGGGGGTGDVLAAGNNSFTGINNFAGLSTFGRNTYSDLQTFNDTVAVNGPLTVSGTAVVGGTLTTSSVGPASSGVYNIGSSAATYNQIWAKSTVSSSGLITGTSVGSTGIDIRQGATYIAGFQPTTGNMYMQAMAAKPADIPSAMLYLNSNSKGFLAPRMTTTERDAIASPAEGLEIYNTTTKAKEFFNGTIWKAPTGGGGGSTGDVLAAGNNGFSGRNVFSDLTTFNDTISVTGPIIANNITSGNLLPISSGVYSVGSSTNRYNSINANNFLGAATTVFGSSLLTTPVGIRHGSSGNYSMYFAPNTSNTIIQEPGVAPTDIPSARLVVNSTTQGALLPRMTTTQRDAISAPAEGLEIYNTTTKAKEFYNGTIWKSGVSSGDVVAAGNNTLSGRNTFSENATFTDTVSVSGPLLVSGATTLSGVTTGTILPISSGVYNLGSTANRFSQLNVNTVLGGASFAYGTSVLSSPISMRHGTNTPLYIQPTTSELSLQEPDVAGAPTAVASSRFTINSTTKGMLIPRMTTAQRDAIASPAEGLQIYNLTTHNREHFNGTIWTTGATAGGAGDVVLAANNAFTGKNTFADNVTVNDTVSITGPLLTTGAATIGGATSVAGVLSTASILPTTAGVPSIGSSSALYNQIWAKSFVAAQEAIFGTSVSSTALLFRQGATYPGGFHSTSGNMFIQPIGAKPTDSGYKLDVTGTVRGTQFFVSALNTAPASATASGTTGEIRITATAIYVCTATNTWVRTALSTF